MTISTSSVGMAALAEVDEVGEDLDRGEEPEYQATTTYLLVTGCA
jgi:hypothetical protein